MSESGTDYNVRSSRIGGSYMIGGMFTTRCSSAGYSYAVQPSKELAGIQPQGDKPPRFAYLESMLY